MFGLKAFITVCKKTGVCMYVTSADSQILISVGTTLRSQAPSSRVLSSARSAKSIKQPRASRLSVVMCFVTGA